jgi:hypothetical protein
MAPGPAEELVAGGVAVLIVVVLEVVDVDHQERHRHAVAQRTLDPERESLVEVAVVEQAGQPVGDRELGQPGVGLGELGPSARRPWPRARGSSRAARGSCPTAGRSGGGSRWSGDTSAGGSRTRGGGWPRPRAWDVLVERGAVDRGDHGVEPDLDGQEDLGGARRAAVDVLEELDPFMPGMIRSAMTTATSSPSRARSSMSSRVSSADWAMARPRRPAPADRGARGGSRSWSAPAATPSSTCRPNPTIRAASRPRFWSPRAPAPPLRSPMRST